MGCLAAALLFSLVGAPRADAARIQCAGTFRVLHDDHVGRLSLPKGNYRITTLSAGRPSCIQASRLFATFLQDFDGRLPRPWRLSVANSTFVREPGVGFHVAPVGSNGGGGVEEEVGGAGKHPGEGRICPAPFRVLHNDRIGRLRLPAGRYMIVRLQLGSFSCRNAATWFTRFLDAYRGNLPAGWKLHPQTATFMRGGVRFRVKPLR